jgi:hypothetical protein
MTFPPVPGGSTFVRARQLGGFYNVAVYGAAGDGVTDDTDAVLAAVAAAVAGGGGLVWVPPAMNCLVSQIIQLGSGVELAGGGCFTSSITANAAVSASNWAASPGGWPAVIAGVAANNCGVRDLDVNANGTSTSGIVMLGGQSVYIRDCYIAGAVGHSGAHFFGTESGSLPAVQQGVMTGNIVEGCLYNYAFDGNDIGCVMTGNVSINPLASHFSLDGGSGLAVIPGQGNSCTGNAGYGGTNGSAGNGVYCRLEQDAVITGNVVTGFEGSNLVYLTNSSATMTGNRFSGNSSAPPTYGLHLNLGNGVSEIAGNVFENAGTGIYTTSGTTPFYGRVRDNDFVNVTTLHSGIPFPNNMELSDNRQLNSSLAVINPSALVNAPSAFLCPPNSYAPAAQTILSTTSATLAAVSSGNACTGSFLAPVSGSVLVTASLVAGISAGVHGSFALAAEGTVTPVLGDVVTYAGTSSTNPPVTVTFVVTGLTPGTSYNFDLLFAVAGGDTMSIAALGVSSTTPTGTLGAPVTMTVQAV